MSGVSPKLIDLQKRIADRIERKKEELGRVNAQLDAANKNYVELSIQATALETVIAEDEALLQNAAPKVRRQRKAKAPQTLGEQAGMDAKEGVQP